MEGKELKTHPPSPKGMAGREAQDIGRRERVVSRNYYRFFSLFMRSVVE